MLSASPTSPRKAVEQVLWAFRDRVHDLKNDRRLRYVLLFKNHGEAAGATLEHTHSQLIALPVVPKRVQEEIAGRAEIPTSSKSGVFSATSSAQETKASGPASSPKPTASSSSSPTPPRFPFETWILPKQHRSHYEEIDAPHLENLAWVLKSTLRKIDKVLERPPYNLLIHTAPLQDPANLFFPLAHRNYSQAYAGRRFRVGHRFLHQPHPAGGVRPIFCATSRSGLNPNQKAAKFRRIAASSLRTSSFGSSTYPRGRRLHLARTKHPHQKSAQRMPLAFIRPPGRHNQPCERRDRIGPPPREHSRSKPSGRRSSPPPFRPPLRCFPNSR